VDFYLPEQRQLIQVAENLAQPTTRNREIRAVKEAIGSVKVQSALILSDINEEPLEIDGQIQSIAEWLLAE
jgi:hypothetical protein